MAFRVRMFKENQNIKYAVYETTWLEGVSKNAAQYDDDIGRGCIEKHPNVKCFDDIQAAYGYRDLLEEDCE